MKMTLTMRIDAVHRARDVFELKVLECFPIGSTVSWRFGVNSLHYGHVVDHGDEGRLQVMDERTGGMCWITHRHLAL